MNIWLSHRIESRAVSNSSEELARSRDVGLQNAQSFFGFDPIDQ